MASGLTPSDFKSVMKQRVRWARGVIQSVYNMKIPFNPDLSFQQKLVYMNSYLYWWSFFRRFLYIFAPILFALFKIRVVDANFWILLIIWAPSYFLVQMVLRHITGNIRTQRWGEIQETVFAPYLVVPVFLESLGVKARTFKVTNKDATTSKKDILYVLPYLILWILVFVSVVKFNYGKFGSEIMYGSVITFWLMMSLINLSFAVLLCLGRPIFRKTERFATVTSVTVTDSLGRAFDLKTDNLSEGGLSFVSDEPLYFPKNRILSFQVKTNLYTANVSGTVVRVFETRKGWTYGVALKRFDNPRDYNEYLQIIHDGFNRYLPQKRDDWETALDDLLENFDQRFNKKKVDRMPTNEFPMVNVNKTVSVDNQEFTLTIFNFETLTLASTSFNKLPESISFNYNGVTFNLSAVSGNVADKRDYKVTNLLELINEPKFHEVMREWGEK